jgi:CheY-like chemotaxis protein
MILMDSEFGDGSGPEAVKQIRQFESKQNNKIRNLGKHKRAPMTILSLSGNDITRQKMSYEDLGIKHFLMKPVNQKQILQILNKYL